MLAILLAFALATAQAPSIPAPVSVAHWDLDGDFASASGAPELVPTSLYRGGRAAYRFQTADLDGHPARVLRVSPATALRLRHGLLPNGGGRLVNSYTLIADLRVGPRSRRGFVGVLQTHGLNVNQADLGLDLHRGVGLVDVFGGQVTWGRWYRLALVVDVARGTATAYLDGVPVASRPVSRDGRYALEPEALLFADDDIELGTLELDTLELRDAPLSAEAIAALGRPGERPLHAPPPPLFKVTAPTAGEPLDAAGVADIRWEVLAAPHGDVRVVLTRDGAPVRALATVPLARRGFVWHVDNDLPPGDGYAIRLEWLGPGHNVATSAPFAILGGAPGLPAIPSQLVTNGRFEDAFTAWQTATGAPQLRRGDSGDGGATVLFGGPDDYTLVQEVPLDARGIDAARVARGLALDASVRLRAREAAGR
ncbi:MAG: hypothetical protein EP329_04455, partial [Deltaproteobacteria bacterium]